MTRALIAILILLGVGTAQAGLTRTELQGVAVSLQSGARIDLSLTAHDVEGRRRSFNNWLGGKPALLVFVDYTCTSLCGSDLRLLAFAIESSGLRTDEYHLLVIGIDPKDPPEAAEKLASGQIPADISATTTLLLPDQDTVERLAKAVGFSYLYDAAIDQFAHPAVAYVLRADGAVVSALSPFETDPWSLARIIREPFNRETLTIPQRIRILCYSLAAETGLYGPRIAAILETAAAGTVFLIVIGILFLVRRTRQ